MGATRRRIYRQPQTYQRIVLTERDKQILETVHAFDGMMSLKQLWRLYFPDCSSDVQPRKRLRDLCNNGYLTMPTSEEGLRWVPLGETVYWLDTKGAQVLADLAGVDAADFKWRRAGRWSKIAHDLAVNDFRLTMTEACERDPELTLVDWVPEGGFLRDRDTITYTTRKGSSKKRMMQPDGWFHVTKTSKRYTGKVNTYAFLVEIDMGTESATRFGRDKVPSGVAYLKSDLYRQRFGMPYGRYVVVTGGEERMMNMKAQTERLGGEKLFYFTTFEQIRAQNALQEPIWWQAGSKNKYSLIPPGD
jgi:hypothetical protein